MDTANGSLRKKTIHGLFWSFLDLGGQSGIQFCTGIVLARLLLPEQFGLIAMLTMFMVISQAFIDSGFGSALIQKDKPSHLDESSVFYFNIITGSLAAGTIFVAAPVIGAFYNTPLLVPIARVLSLNLIIGAFGSIQGLLATKRLDFKTPMRIGMLASALSGLIAISMAYSGYGVWSLVAQSLTSTAVRATMLWFLLPWRPALRFSPASLRSMFPFGSKLLLSGILDSIYNNLYLIVIGKVFSSVQLGYYARARNTEELPARLLSSAVGRVTFPVFSLVQHDKVRLKRILRKALTTLMLVNFPVMIGLAIVARPLVLVLFTEKWLPCVVYLQLLCGVGMLYPLHYINLNVLKAQGRSDLFFRLEIIKKVLTTATILVTWRWGISVMILGEICTSFIAYYLNSYYTGKLVDYPITEQASDFLPSLLVAASMGLVVIAVGHFPYPSNSALLVAQVASGAAVYVALCFKCKMLDVTELRRSFSAG